MTNRGDWQIFCGLTHWILVEFSPGSVHDKRNEMEGWRSNQHELLAVHPPSVNTRSVPEDSDRKNRTRLSKTGGFPENSAGNLLSRYVRQKPSTYCIYHTTSRSKLFAVSVSYLMYCHVGLKQSEPTGEEEKDYWRCGLVCVCVCNNQKEWTNRSRNGNSGTGRKSDPARNLATPLAFLERGGRTNRM